MIKLVRALRSLVVVAALAALMGVTIASTSSAHFHTGSAANRCDLCFTAHTSASETPVAQSLPVPAMQGRITLLLPSSTYRPVSRQSSPSRGPPSFTL